MPVSGSDRFVSSLSLPPALKRINEVLNVLFKYVNCVVVRNVLASHLNTIVLTNGLFTAMPPICEMKAKQKELFF